LEDLGLENNDKGVGIMETQQITEKIQEKALGFLIPFAQSNRVELSEVTAIKIGDFLSIGRDQSCSLTLKDPFVSSRHARIERKPIGYVLRDLQSRNGSFLNDSRVIEAPLSQNDRIRFGESIFVFSGAPNVRPSLSSKNSNWNQQLKRLPVFAATEFPILIYGPSGSGKEILAREIHAKSERSQSPFISINCSTLSENLIESELFGHVKGSFTGAIHDRKGAFEAARGGTLFLDEIGDLPLSLQPKFLRALENNEIRPVGTDRSISTDVRILAATHRHLALNVKQGSFREDLFYRLNVCHLRPPALIHRLEDFEDLIYQFAKTYRVRFSFNAIEKLKEQPWPGNIRELKNLVARVSAYFPGKHIQPEDLSTVLEIPLIGAKETLSSRAPATDGTPYSAIKGIERDMIISRLIANHGNQRRTAQELGMPKSTLHDRIKTYSIDLRALTDSEQEVTV
jgi:DNA-binding NtrC family response regulator